MGGCITKWRGEPLAGGGSCKCVPEYSKRQRNSGLRGGLVELCVRGRLSSVRLKSHID